MVSRKLQRREFLASGLVGTATLLGAPALAHASNFYQQLDGVAFGTRWRALLSGALDDNQARSIIEKVVAQVDASMSPYRPDSEISVFNAMPAGYTCKFSAGTARVLQQSFEITRASNGAYDPGVGPIVNRYGFGPIKGRYVPFLAGIEQRGDQITKLRDSATVDLCGIAKGFAIDLIRDRLLQAGVKNALVEIGGEFAAMGVHPSGRDWRVAVENPQAGMAGAVTAVRLGGRAIATSGHRHQGIKGLAAMTHIISPQQQRPTDQQVLSSSVIADTAMDADAWSTSLCALTPAQAIELALQAGIDALIIRANRDGNGEQVVRTGQFSDHEVTA